MGLVLEGRSASSGERVAIKLIASSQLRSEAARERFEREARLLAALDNPRVVRVLDFGEDQGRPYFVMQYLEGDTLTAYIKRKAPMKLAAALEIMVPIAEGVAELHAHGILHRDLKPANVMITPSSGPRLVDFGLARDVADDHLTRPGEFIGTMEYAAPETLRGQAPRPASDVFALGLIMFELLTGERAGRRPDAADELREIMSRDPVLDGAAGMLVRENLIGMMSRSVSPEPQARPADGATFLRVLRQAQTDVARLRAPVPVAPTAPPPAAPVPRTSLASWFLLVAVSAGALGLLWFASQMLRRGGS